MSHFPTPPSTLPVEEQLSWQQRQEKARQLSGLSETGVLQVSLPTLDLLQRYVRGELTLEQPAVAYVPEHLDVRTNLRWLHPDQRVVVDLFYFQGYTQAEIAAQLGLPLGTVKTRSRQGVRQLALLYRAAPEGVEPRRKRRVPYHYLAPHCV